VGHKNYVRGPVIGPHWFKATTVWKCNNLNKLNFIAPKSV